MKKRILGFVLALCLIIGLLPVISLADTPATPQAITLTFHDSARYNSTATTQAVPAGDKYYATTNSEGVVTPVGLLSTLSGAPANNEWTIMLDNTQATAVLVLNGATVKSIYANNIGTWNASIMVAGDGALEIRTTATSTIHYGRWLGIRTDMGQGTTYTTVGDAQLNVLCGDNTTAFGAIQEWVGDLTFKNAKINTTSCYALDTAPTQAYTIYAKKNLTIDGGDVDVLADASVAKAVYAGQNLTIENGADVYVKNYGANEAVKVDGSTFAINGASLKVHAYITNTAAYFFNKMPTLENGVTAKYIDTQYRYWTYIPEDAEWQTLEVAGGTDLTDGSNKYWTYSFEKCEHANAGTQTDCTVAVTCPDCGTTVAAAQAAHSPEADDGDCTTAQKCTVCQKVLVEAAASHTVNRTDCTTAATCSVCNKVVYEAGQHSGGTATCKAKAKCEFCNQEYGELAACTPAADDGDCTTAIKCSVCGEDAVAAKDAHKYTDNTDTTCDNAGCTHTRTVENGGKNPQTGDNTMITLFVVLAALSATAAVIFTKKRNII